MSILKLDTDGSIYFEWIAAIGFDNEFTLSFVDTVGAAFDISSYTFSVQLRREGTTDNILELTQSSGLTNNGALGTVTGLIGVTNSQLFNHKARYVCQVTVTYPSAKKHRWFNGLYLPSREIHTNTTNNAAGTINIGGVTLEGTITIGSGDVTGPASSTDNAIVLFDGTTGKLIKDSGVLLSTLQKLVNSATALVDGATIDLTAIKHTLATAASRTFTISYTGDDITLEVTLSATSATQTFPATALCVSEGVASGDNTLAMSGVSGDKYMIAIKKVGSAYYVVGKNFGQ